MRLFFSIIIISLACSCNSGTGPEGDLKIDLRGEQLTSIPDSVFGIKGITELDLGSRKIIVYPPLSALRDTNSNNIAEIPEKISGLVSLRTLTLNSNKLTNLPDGISKLVNLEVLDLSLNNDLDIIEQLDKLKKLPKLKLLKIVDVKLSQTDIPLLRSSLSKRTKLIIDIPEYLNSVK